MTRRSALSRAVGWGISILGGAIVTVAVEGGLIGGWAGAVLAAAGTVVVSVGVNMVAFDIRYAKGQSD